jgi:cellulose biosynthesis protein BcsQ
MKFTRTKVLSFVNNKGGVGKTTLAFNVAAKFAEKGYKTVLIDLDAQCNLTRLAVGDGYVEAAIYGDHEHSVSTIYDVLKGVIQGGSDVNLDIPFSKVGSLNDNLLLLYGDMKISQYENLLPIAFNAAAGANPLGFFQTSAIQRYLRQKGMKDQIDIFVIDTSPSLNALNQAICLTTDYFVVPVMPDAFSLQGIENLGRTYEDWKEKWKLTAGAIADKGGIDVQNFLRGEGMFIGYILNSYNVYGEQPIKDHRKWIEKIPGQVKEFLSERHSRNGLVTESYTNSLEDIQDFGRLPSYTHATGQAIFDIDPKIVTEPGSKENIAKAAQEFDELADKIIAIMKEY